MTIVKHIADLKKELDRLRAAGDQIGFVPTMGALHEGHVSLIRRSVSENAVTVCSIFVNPTQFNNPADLEKYPVTIEKDIDMLEEAGCTILFLPAVKEMYPPGEEKVVHYNLGYLETILEGEFRPGHFQGVCIIVDKLLSIVKPDALYLGRKDYQQCMVISKMMRERGHHSVLHICDTVREEDGLAMSSRNLRLNTEERKKAVKIIECLRMMKESFGKKPVQQIRENAVKFLEENGFRPEYTEIADAETLMPVQNENSKAVALIAAWLNEIRLIDNLVL